MVKHSKNTPQKFDWFYICIQRCDKFVFVYTDGSKFYTQNVFAIR